ncbi:MAG: cyclic nucleotide-binding domain-containing protein [Betaproteobacteria bacterium]|nr:cyclic nucleotide-binding domain-containing protein [Betaproteobacteria bacterium]
MSRMDELDFSKPAGKPAAPAQPPVNLAAALEFFRTSGVAENVDTGTNIFVEDERAGLFSFKSRKMYLLLEGEVNLIAANKLIGVVRAGEIFGEMAAISESPRAATAVAKVPCRLISMDEKGFHAALKAKPDFALTLLGMMINRLRGMLARLPSAAALGEAKKEAKVFDKGLLAALARGLGPTNSARYEKGKTIMTEGQAGAMMYVVLEGRVAVSIQGKVVERVGPGGVLGEMALIDQSPRAATALAETDSVLLTLNRGVFLQLVKTQPEFGVALLAATAERVRFMASR